MPWKALTASQAVANGRQLRFAAGACDLVWKSGDLDDAGLKRFVEAGAADATEGWQVQVSTNGSSQASYGGYAAATVPANGWTFTQEAD